LILNSPQIYRDFSQISHNFKGILLDAYGVFWGGNAFGVLPGAKETMEQLVSDGKTVGILSNSTQLSANEIDKLQQHGILEGKHFHFLVTSGEVARGLFLNGSPPFPTPLKKFWVFGGSHPRFSSHEAIFEGTPYSETDALKEADFIYIGVPHIKGEDQTNPELFRMEIEGLAEKNIPMVCANPDRFAHEGNPPKAVVRQGSIAALYEKMGGKVHYFGKPYVKTFLIAKEQFDSRMSLNLKEILMVGDTPETDIRGARQFGIFSALTTQTGIMADRISHHGLEQALLNLTSDELPDFFIERLADGI
jgi:HAD superfamily hydrolase (TIGR01459 family)